MTIFIGVLNLFAIATYIASSAVAQDCFTADDCNFYTCLESKYNCGPKGYPISYGLKYCEVFLENHESFNAVAQKWLTGVRLCLQDALVPLANNPDKIGCDALKEFAYDSHAPCYTQPGNSICDIGIIQVLKVIKLIGLQLMPENFELLIKIVKACGFPGLDSLILNKVMEV